MSDPSFLRTGDPTIKGPSVKGGNFFKEAHGCFPLRIEHYVDIYKDPSGHK
jgi:hypothetical protein